MSKLVIFVLWDLEIWWMTLKSNRAPLLCYLKFSASFCSHLWNQTRVTVLKYSIQVNIGDFLSRVTLKYDGWMTLKKNSVPLLCYFKVCASFLGHMWNQNGTTAQKHLIQVIIGEFLSCVALKSDGWLWPSAWTSLLSMVITPENFIMIPWEAHFKKDVTDRWMDRETEPFLKLLGRS